MSQVFGLLFFYFFCCSCVPLLEDTGVAPLSIPPSFLLSSSPSLHLTAPWGVSVASPLLSSPLLSVCVCVRARCCGRRLLPVPPYLHLLQSSANTHLLCALSLFLSLSLHLFFPTTYISLPTTIFFLLFFLLRGRVVLMRGESKRAPPPEERERKKERDGALTSRHFRVLGTAVNRRERAPDGLGAVKPTSLTAD